MEHLTGTMDILRSWGVAHHVRPARARLSLCCLACCKPDLTDILPTVAVFLAGSSAPRDLSFAHLPRAED